MKKLLLPFLLLTASYLGAQTTLWNDKFDMAFGLSKYNSGDLDNPTFTNLFKNVTTNWQMPTVNNQSTGTVTFESRYNVSTGGNLTNDGLPENAFLITKTPFSTVGYSVVFMSPTFHFESVAGDNLDHGYIEVSTDSTNWTIVYDIINGSYGTDFVSLPAGFVGQAKVWTRIRYKGNYSGLYILDELKYYAPVANEVQNRGITNATYSTGTINPSFVVFNYGGTAITSLDVSYSDNGGAPVSAVISGLNIAPLTGATVTHPTPWSPAAGFHTLVVNISKVNAATDANSLDNSATKQLIIYGGSTTVRKPLYEIFTSSTCGPCTPGNINFHSIVDPKDQNEFVAIKYQQDFPGTGDPYCTTEGVNRRAYYAINSIPRMEIDGLWDGNAQSFTSTMYDAQRALPSVYDLTGTYTFDTATKTFSVKVNHTPKFNMPASALKLYVAIIESITTKNKKSNGESSFEQVMKKMLPTETGTTITNLTSGVQGTDSFTFKFNGAYRLPADGQSGSRINNSTEFSVENFNNLQVVAWVQHTATKQVLQSGHIVKKSLTGGGVAISNVDVISSVAITPNPVAETATIGLKLTEAADITVSIVNTIGQEMFNETYNLNSGDSNIPVNVNSFANGNYIVKLISGGSVISTSKFAVSK